MAEILTYSVLDNRTNTRTYFKKEVDEIKKSNNGKNLKIIISDSGDELLQINCYESNIKDVLSENICKLI